MTSVKVRRPKDDLRGARSMEQIRFFYELTESDTPAALPSNKLIDLLDAVERRGSLSAAVAADFDVSYRHAWNELGKWEKRLGRPLLERGRGKPGELTPFARKLLSGVRAVHAEYRAPLAAMQADLLQAFASALHEDRPVLTVSGCPDRAVTELKKAAFAGSFFLDVRFSSSRRGLQALAHDLTQITGFNLPVGAGPESAPAQAFRQFLDPKTMVLIRFCTRIQGLALAKGNPLAIRSLLDVSLKKARYAQRAPGSGTRVLFDDLMRASGMSASDIAVTVAADSHAEAAALIAQGKADAGLCLANVAADAGLDFIAISREIYLFACRRELLETSPGRDFPALLAASEWKTKGPMPAGYDFTGCGEVLEIPKALPWFDTDAA